MFARRRRGRPRVRPGLLRKEKSKDHSSAGACAGDGLAAGKSSLDAIHESARFVEPKQQECREIDEAIRRENGDCNKGIVGARVAVEKIGHVMAEEIVNSVAGRCGNKRRSPKFRQVLDRQPCAADAAIERAAQKMELHP